MEVRDCLRAYRLEAQLKSHKIAFNKFTKDVLIKSLTFLNSAPEGKSWNSLLKQDIANELICRIQNLLLDNCSICGVAFATKLDEKPLLECELCGQNIHMPCLRNILGENYHENITKEEVLHIINPLGMNGVHYLCSSCSNSTIPCSTSHSPENTSVINIHNEYMDVFT